MEGNPITERPLFESVCVHSGLMCVSSTEDSSDKTFPRLFVHLCSCVLAKRTDSLFE